MSNPERSTGVLWTRERAALLALVCLIVGIAGGWIIRGSGGAGASSASATVASAAPLSNAATSDQAKQALDPQAAPLLERLKSDPNNLETLTNLGNIYYDAKQYSTAIGYYQRVLKLKPENAQVRTDLGTAYWYMNDADAAITEFDAALTFAPNNPNTLFNRGIVKWQGKKDAAGAIADWQKLLATNPNYEGKDQVKGLLDEVSGKQAAK